MNEQELTRLVEKFSRTVYGVAYCYLHNSADADDIMQDTFLALYTSNVEFVRDEHVKAWLIQVAVNKCKNLLRSFKNRATVSLDEAAEIPSEDKCCSGSESVLPMVMKLKPKSRMVLYMFYYEDMSVKQIAEALGEKTTTVTSQLARARQQLKRILEKEDFYEY
ncbi:MAG: RNA polymerase sigma factor [Ruminiclostridium sp.]